MKTTDPARYFRNAASPAARLARWQEPSFHRPNFRAGIEPLSAIDSRLAQIRKLPDYAGKTLAERRRYLIQNDAAGPELSSPDADAALLWIDDLDASPLVASHWQGGEFLDHRGWFTDDFQEDTLEACAVQLKAFPHLIFEAIRNSTGGSVCVYLEDFHAIDYSDAENNYDAGDAVKEAAKDAIRSADSTAEHQAEKERLYQAEEDRKRQAEEARADLDRNRATARALIADLRQICPTDLPASYPAAAAAIRAQVAAILHRRRETLDTIAEHKAALA